MKEFRIYIVTHGDWAEYSFDRGLSGTLESLTDDQFMAVAEDYGLVYTLNGFERDWNEGYAPSPDYSSMRIIEVELL